jgi:hypothetical protein
VPSLAIKYVPVHGFTSSPSARSRPAGGLLSVVPAEEGRHLRRPKFREEYAVLDGNSKLLRITLRSSGGIHTAAGPAALEEACASRYPRKSLLYLQPDLDQPANSFGPVWRITLSFSPKDNLFLGV